MDKINVGIVKMIILNKLNESLLNEKSLHDLKELSTNFCNTVNSSPLLKLEYKLFENLSNKSIENDVVATRYIDNMVKLFENYSIEEINSEHNKLNEFISESDLSNISTKVLSLNESIHNLVTESLKKDNSVDIDLLHESFTNVLGHIKSNKIDPVIVENKNNDNVLNKDVVNIAINKFNEKYDMLGEDDKTLLTLLTKSTKEEKKSLFENYKIDVKSILTNLKNDETKDKIDESLSKIDKMDYNNKTINDDIITLYELKKALV